MLILILPVELQRFQDIALIVAEGHLPGQILTGQFISDLDLLFLIRLVFA